MNAKKNVTGCVKGICGLMLVCALSMGQGCPAPTALPDALDSVGQGSSNTNNGGSQSFQTASSAGSNAVFQPSAPAASQCPSSEQIRARMTPATYAVVVEFLDPTQGPWAAGTAFAIGDHLLATNAHVVAAVTESESVGTPVKRVVAVQAETGAVVTLLRAAKHPHYTGVQSPDVGLFTTVEKLANVLPLATDSQVADLASGNVLEITGFPGDVTQVFPITPGVSQPVATALAGQISGLRQFNGQTANSATVDIIQHNAATTPGSSGSPMVRCDLVVGVNNAGTVRYVAVPGPNGELRFERQTQADNNFGIHVKHLRDLVDLFQKNVATVVDLPAPFNGAAPFAGTYQAAVQGQRPHQIQFAVQANGTVSGIATLGQAQLTLSGIANIAGDVIMWDNRDQFGYEIAYYEGRIDAQTRRAEGIYKEGALNRLPIGQWSTAASVTTGGNSGSGSNANVGALAGSYTGSIPSGQRKHSFQFTVSSSGQVSGTATWGESVFKLTGKVDANGKLAMIDDGEQYQVPVGIYVGTINAQTGQAAGTYSEGNVENVLNQWTAARGSGSSTGGSTTGGGNSGNTSNQGVSFRGTVMSDQLPHTIQFTVSNGKITGTSTWGSARYNLTGSVDNNLNVRMQDDDPQYPGVYVGTINIQTLQASGVFGINGNVYGQWVAQAQ